MKISSQDEMIALAWPDGQSISAAQEKLLPITGALDAEKDWLATGLIKGIYSAREIQRDGKPEYVFFWYLNARGFLEIVASAFVGSGRPDSWLWCLGADMIAREQRARGITAETVRLGHVEQCRRVGYKVTGVRLEKKVEA